MFFFKHISDWDIGNHFLRLKLCKNWYRFYINLIRICQGIDLYTFFTSSKDISLQTHYEKFWCSNSVKIFFFLNPPFFVSMATAAKVCPTDSIRCGCCSYQVSSISVWRVTCYDHLCVFQFFWILSVSMATVAILKIPKVVCTSTHSA